MTKAESVLEIDLCVLLRYEDMSSRQTDPGCMRCCHDLRFKYNTIRYNLFVGRHLENPNISIFAAGAPPVLRDLIRHEIQKNFTFEEQNYAFMIQAHTRRDPSLFDLAKMTDNDILKLSLMGIQMNEELGIHSTTVTGKDLRKVSLQKCDQCNKIEEFRGDFQCCGGCKKSHYCTKECQKLNWKKHKVICKSSK